jgi:hypothetical protein
MPHVNGYDYPLLEPGWVYLELYECLDKHYEKTKQTYLAVNDVSSIQEAPQLEQLSRRRAGSLYKLVLGQHGQLGWVTESGISPVVYEYTVL